MTRIGLFCKMAAPVGLGFVLSFASIEVSLLFVCLWNVLSIFPEVGLLLYLHQKVPGLQKKIEVKKKQNVFVALWHGWKVYFNAKEVFLASFSFVLLFWTALSPGALMSAYLLTHGFSELIISVYMGISSIIGMIPTFFTPYLFKKFSIEKTGLFSIWSQDACLLVCVIFFFIPNIAYVFEMTFGGSFRDMKFANIFGEHSLPLSWNIWVFLIFLVFSRIGLWTFDLAERQIMQEYVPEEKRGMINSVEYSLTNVFSLLSFGMGIILSKPDQFGGLVIVSFLAVTMACICYSYWMRRIATVQRSDIALRMEEEMKE